MSAADDGTATAPEGRTRRRVAPLAVAAAGIALLGGTLITHSTWSGFSATTGNSGNSFQAATIDLSDNDGGYTMFSTTGTNPSANAAGMTPGHPVVECLKVVYTSDAATTTPHVTFAAAYGAVPTSTLSTYLNVKVERGTVAGTPTFTGGTRNSCGSGFTADSSAALYNGTLANLVTSTGTTPLDTGTWTNRDEHYFRITAEVADNVAAMGKSSTPVDFTWRATSD